MNEQIKKIIGTPIRTRCATFQESEWLVESTAKELQTLIDDERRKAVEYYKNHMAFVLTNGGFLKLVEIKDEFLSSQVKEAK